MKQHYPIVILSLAIVAFLLLVFAGRDLPLIGLGETQNEFEDLRRNIAVYIHSEGPASALDAIMDATQEGGISYDECHVLMHLAGHGAYEYYSGDLGIVGFNSRSGRECLGGFVHGLEAEIVLSDAEPIKKLHQLCDTAKELGVNHGPCYHGAGHASLELTEDVHESLSFCDSLEAEVEPNLSGCYRGVFSELNNLILGFDRNSGIARNGTEYPGIDSDNPYAFCAELAERYREGCYTQSTMLMLASNDIESALPKCLSQEYSPYAQSTCVHIMIAVDSRNRLSAESSYIAPGVLNTFPQRLQDASVEGARETYKGLLADPYNKKWEPFCDSYEHTTVRDSCYEVFQSLEKRNISKNKALL